MTDNIRPHREIHLHCVVRSDWRMCLKTLQDLRNNHDLRTQDLTAHNSDGTLLLTHANNVTIFSIRPISNQLHLVFAIYSHQLCLLLHQNYLSKYQQEFICDSAHH